MISRVVLFGMLSVLVACNEQYTVIYKNIYAADKWDEVGKITINSTGQVPEKFIFNQCDLHLPILKKSVSWFIFNEKEMIDWRKEDMQALLAAYPELAREVPEGWNNWLSEGFGDECKPGAR